MTIDPEDAGEWRNAPSGWPEVTIRPIDLSGHPGVEVNAGDLRTYGRTSGSVGVSWLTTREARELAVILTSAADTAEGCPVRRDPDLLARQRADMARDGVREAPLVGCRPWCVDGDGHPAQCHSDDQWCKPPEITFPVTLYPPAERLDGTFLPEEITFYGAHHHNARVDRVIVDMGDMTVLRLTFAETKALADALLVTLAVMTEGGAS